MIMNLKIFKLHFISPLHLSKGKVDDYGESDEVLHSDTLKSALYVCARQIFGVDKIGGDTSFFESLNISSAFPFYKNEYFFPKPMVKIQPFINSEVKEELQPKKHKKINYIGTEYFEDLINERKLLIASKFVSPDGRFLSNLIPFENLSEPILKSEVQQRVTIPLGYSSDPVPYYVDRLYFNEHAGLWFAIEGDESFLNIVTKSLRLLGDTGIGTDKNVGNGQFEITEGNITLKIPENSNFQMTLSLYCPKREEVENDLLLNSSYGLIKRGGYIASPDDIKNLTLRKKSIYMFTEGSIFPNNEKLVGRITDLRPDISRVDHSIWRDGKGFMIPLNKDEE